MQDVDLRRRRSTQDGDPRGRFSLASLDDVFGVT
jgi:hypothetical protein